MDSSVTYARWMTLAATEYRRLDDLVGTLSADQFELPTDCPGWDVRAVVSHVAGGAAASGKVTEALRQLRAGRRLLPGADMIEAANAVHVSERRDLTPAELRADLRRAAEGGMRRRRGLPAPVRSIRVPVGPPPGTVSLGRLLGCIITRDA